MCPWLGPAHVPPPPPLCSARVPGPALGTRGLLAGGRMTAPGKQSLQEGPRVSPITGGGWGSPRKDFSPPPLLKTQWAPLGRDQKEEEEGTTQVGLAESVRRPQSHRLVHSHRRKTGSGLAVQFRSSSVSCAVAGLVSGQERSGQGGELLTGSSHLKRLQVWAARLEATPGHSALCTEPGKGSSVTSAA